MAPSQVAAPPPAGDPDWLSEVHPDIVAVYRYWRAKAAGRAMPSRADLDPADLVPYLPSMMLVDVEPGAGRPNYVYRLVGTREVAVRGNDPTGKPVETHHFGRSLADAFENYDQVVASRAPWIDRAHLLSFDSMILDLDKLFLPLSSDGVEVDIILVFTLQERLA